LVILKKYINDARSHERQGYSLCSVTFLLVCFPSVLWPTFGYLGQTAIGRN
jgi:hypothetical protein